MEEIIFWQFLVGGVIYHISPLSASFQATEEGEDLSVLDGVTHLSE